MRLTAALILLSLVTACRPDFGPAPPGATDGDEPGHNVTGQHWLATTPCNYGADDPNEMILTAWLPEPSTGRWHKFRLEFGNYGWQVIRVLSSQLYYDQNIWPGTACWDMAPQDWSEQFVTGNTGYTPSDFYMMYNMYTPTMSSGSDSSGAWVRVQARFDSPSTSLHQWITRDSYTWIKEY